MRSAFTLIELLVVIFIIAVLGAILFPVFAPASGSGKTRMGEPVTFDMRSETRTFSSYCPNTATVGQPFTVSATIQPKSGKQPDARAGESTTRVTSEMEASLVSSDPAALAVNGEGRSRQVVETNYITKWTWSVTPKKPARSVLFLTLDMIEKGKSSSSKKTITSVEKTIVVRAVDAPSEPSSMESSKTIGMICEVVAKVVGAILAILAALLGIKKLRLEIQKLGKEVSK